MVRTLDIANAKAAPITSSSGSAFADIAVVGDLSVDEVAAVLGKSPNWVRVNQHRGLRRLAERLDPKVGVIR